MKQKDKDLLLKDLSARLPYGVILSVGIFDNGNMKYHNEKLDYHSNLLSIIELDGGYYLNGLLYKYSQFIAKPYLRPMLSMTEEEKIESIDFAWEDDYGRLVSYNENIPKYIDWLNAHHFDYRGLIPMGLALEAPEGMYKTK